MLSEVLDVHRDSISQSGSCLGSVRVHSLILLHIFLQSQEYVMWLMGFFLTRTLASFLLWLPGLLLSSQPYNPFALVASPKLGLWHEISLIHIDGVWFSSHKGASCLGYHKSTNMWKLGGVVKCFVSKASFAYARLETIMFHYGWCPTRTPNITISCTLIFYFLLHCLMLWYYVSMGIP